MRDRIRKILKESFSEFDWIGDIEPTFKNWNFKFDGKHEYWVDISMLDADEHKLIFDYIKKVVPYDTSDTKFARLGFWNGIVIHCGYDDNDYFPEENHICFMPEKFDEDNETENSIYIDGGEILEYIKATSKDNLKESSGWTDDKDSTYWGTDPYWGGSDKSFSSKDPDWELNADKSYWKQGPGSTGGESSGGGEETVKEEEDLESEEDPFYWLRDSEAHPNYNGHPQGVVYLYNHDEIDEFCDIIENYNGGVLPRGDVRDNLHNGLEFRRNDLEEDGRDPSEAVLSVSFFVERKEPGVLSVGFWDYDVDPEGIREWLKYGDETFNHEYKLYTNLNYVRKVFEDYQNPELIKESEGDLDWIKDVPGEEGYGEKYRFFDIYVCFGWEDISEYGQCMDGYSAFIKIPKYEVDGKWKGKYGMKLIVTKWAIENEQFDSEDYSAIEYVREIDKDEYLRATGDPDLLS